MRRGGFTLVELITVIAIIGILLGLVLPGASRMWSQRNEAGTTNMVRGLLASAKSQAIRTGDRGLFFWTDKEGHQHVVFIEADPPGRAPTDRDVLDCTADSQPDDCITEVEAFNRFRVVPGKVYSIPPPYRVTPLWAIETTASNPEAAANWPTWPQLLANGAFPVNTDGRDTPRYHRNIFTIVFNARGELVVGRDVLIHDYDSGADQLGDMTRLRVVDVTDYWQQPGTSAIPQSRAIPTSESGTGELYHIVALDDDRAANFASVAGLLVYDDSSVDGLGGGEIQDVLITDGQPIYVSRYTGDVVLGPKGE